MYMWCRAHVVHVMLCTFGIMYTLYNGVVYMWHCVHIVQVVPCTCDVVHKLCSWLLCTGGILYMWYIWYWCRFMYCMVLYDVCSCMCVMHTMCMCTWLRRRRWVFSGVEIDPECIQNKEKGRS